jgi:hypothetical protein
MIESLHPWEALREPPDLKKLSLFCCWLHPFLDSSCAKPPSTGGL